MGDIALIWDTATGTMDIEIDSEADDLTSDEGMRTAVLMSLFLDARAEPEDTLPDNSGDRRGWLGDELAENDGDRIGSRLWLVLNRGKLTPDIVRQVEQYSAQALQWLVEDGAASAVDVTAELLPNGVAWAVDIERPGRGTLSFRFDHVWTAEAARAL